MESNLQELQECINALSEAIAAEERRREAQDLFVVILCAGILAIVAFLVTLIK